jgi:hypothetical protein
MLFGVKEWDAQPLKPHWRDPFVVYSIPTAVNVAETVIWIHKSPVKPASLKWDASLTQSHCERSPFRVPAPSPSRTLLPRRQQETTDNKTSALL